jgi:ADP-glucose pyrophosphorylase
MATLLIHVCTALFSRSVRESLVSINSNVWSNVSKSVISDFIDVSRKQIVLAFLFLKTIYLKKEFTVKASKNCKIFWNYYLPKGFMVCIDASQLTSPS